MRSAGALRQNYEQILQKVRESDVVYSDETGIKVNGKIHWIWAFAADGKAAFIITNSRGKKVLEEALKDYKGVIVCGGWKPYSSFTDRIQLCWSHLLREADHLAENEDEAKPLADALHRMYDDAKEVLDKDPPPNHDLWRLMRRWLGIWLRKNYKSDAVKKFVAKIENGFDYWFTFILVPGVEPTNNRAERALREQVVQRKIIGTLRNSRGTFANETIMSVLATWEQSGLNPHEEMMNVL
jgi:transposase-like protein